MWKRLEDAAWPLKVGEVQLVEAPTGYLLVKKTGQTEARAKTFDEVKDQIERTLRLQKRNDEFRKWRSEAKIEILAKGDESVIAADRGANQPAATSQPTAVR
jgi:parvulin-like peptidyl-prolyl isomerase